jgi:hypothetical protein
MRNPGVLGPDRDHAGDVDEHVGVAQHRGRRGRSIPKCRALGT